MRDVAPFRASSPPEEPGPVVFVVDDDISVRESLELLIASAGWRPDTFASAEEFLSRPRAGVPCCLILDVRMNCSSSLPNEPRCRSSSLPVSAMYRSPSRQ
jgi:FixJ family two-component response regulator